MMNSDMPNFENAEHIGDIEHNKILHKIISGVEYYVIMVGEIPTCFIQTQPLEILGNNYLYVRNAYTEKEYQNQTLAKKLLFFLRNVEKKSIILGNAKKIVGNYFKAQFINSLNLLIIETSLSNKWCFIMF